MDSLIPPLRRPVTPAAAHLEILGHHAVGPVHLCRDVRRPGRGRRLVRAAAGRAVRCRRGDPRRRRRPDDLALGDHGIARRAAGDVDRDRVRRARPLPIIWRCAGPRGATSAIGVVALVILVGGWDLLSRALGREVTPGFMGEVLKSAQADGALWLLVIAFCVAAPMSEEIFSPAGFSTAAGRNRSARACAGAILLSSLVWTSLHLQYDWFFFGEVFSIGLLLGWLRYRTQLDLADGGPARPQQSRGDGAEHSGWRDIPDLSNWKPRCSDQRAEFPCRQPRLPTPPPLPVVQRPPRTLDFGAPALTGLLILRRRCLSVMIAVVGLLRLPGG